MTDRRDWKIGDDSRPLNDQFVYRGPAVMARSLLRAALAADGKVTLPDGKTVTVSVVNGYIEDPSGRQFGWNKHTLAWERL